MKNEKIPFDLFVVFWNILQNQSTPPVHIRIARWLEAGWYSKDKRLLLMAFRSCGKSTLVGLFAAWLLYCNPNLRILVLAADLVLARKMVRNVKRIIEKHLLTCDLKPSCPEEWAADQFTIKRSRELRDPSVLARSVSANMTGSRADVILYDDVEVPNTCETPEKRNFLRERLLEASYVLTPKGLQLYIGTPHHYYSIYAATPREEIGEERVFLDGFQRLEIPIKNTFGESVWPERFPLDVIDSIEQSTGPNKFQSQMMLQAVNILDSRLNVGAVQVFDRQKSDYAARLSCLYWDPAFASADTKKKGDQSVLAYVTTDGRGCYVLEHLVYLQAEPHDTDEASSQCRQVVDFACEFGLRKICVETNGIGKFLPGLLRKAIRGRQLEMAVEERVNNRPKAVRILEAFDAVLAARAFYVDTSVLQTPFLQEMREWHPSRAKTGCDDALDAVSGAMAILQKNGMGGMFLSKKHIVAPSDFDPRGEF